MKRIKCKNIISSNGIFDGYIYFEDGKIKELSDKAYSADEEYDAGDLYLSAGWIDIHTHGGGGYSFDGSVEEIISACDFHLKHGTTSICPTVSAAPFEKMAACAEKIQAASRSSQLKNTIIGAHLEGPYLSKKQCGAQCCDHITSPKADEYLPFLEKNTSAVARWSYAPENDLDGGFLKALGSFHVVPSIGHSDAAYRHILPAFENGCKLVTHLYSCTSTVTRDHGFRSLGVIESAYLLDDMFAEIICDGKHLPAELIKMIYKIKGADRVALVTDSLSLAGTKETHGFMQDTEYLIEDGVCKLVDRSAFAGSIATADRLVRVAVKEAGISLLDAVKMITATPAKIMGLENKGAILPGMDADMVIFDEDINVKQVFCGGRKVLENKI